MNGFSELWQGVVDELNANNVSLGISAAVRAATGKVTTLVPPSAAVWLNLGVPGKTSQRGAIQFPTDVIIYCISSPKVNEADAVDGALEIAGKVLRHLTNKEISGVVLQQPENEPAIEVVERSSTQAIVGVLLKAEVDL